MGPLKGLCVGAAVCAVLAGVAATFLSRAPLQSEDCIGEGLRKTVSRGFIDDLKACIQYDEDYGSHFSADVKADKYYYLHQLYLSKGEIELAIESLEKSVKIKKANYHYTDLGKLYERVERGQDALQAYKAAVRVGFGAEAAKEGIKRAELLIYQQARAAYEAENQPRAKRAISSSPIAAAPTKSPISPVQQVSPADIQQVRTTKRLALIIGNGRYENIPELRNPIADAQSVADKLRRQGFAVELSVNASRSALLATVGAFLRSITKDSEVVLFYAGHGVELDGANYIVPVDVPALSSDAEELIKDNSVNLNSLLVEISRRDAGASIVIIDACRDNPFRNVQVAGLSRSITGKDGLAPMAAPRGVFVIYSAGVNEQALDRLGDDDDDPNGLFTRKLLPLIDEEGLEVRAMTTRLRREVSAAARGVTITESGGHRQSPASYDQMDGEFYFAPSRVSSTSRP